MRTQQEGTDYEQKEGPHPTMLHLTSWTPACRTLSKKYFVVCKVPRLWHFVTAALMDGDETTSLDNCLVYQCTKETWVTPSFPHAAAMPVVKTSTEELAWHSSEDNALES